MPRAFRLYHPLQIYTFLSLLSPIRPVYAHGQSQSKAPSTNTFELTETYDQPTKLNSISVVNPAALNTTCPLDAEVRKTQEDISQLSDYSDIVRDWLT
jgi:hypothetical protein